MLRLFDAYIMVDWSASSKPVTGANSIWVGVRARDARLKFQFTSANPSTRLRARTLIVDIAQKLIARGDKVLLGFDFALGYPFGTAKAAGFDLTDQTPWAAMHHHLQSKIKEREDNSNARFAIAASLNYAISQSAHPFWGVPKTSVSSTLAMKKGDFSAPSSLPEHRLSEAWIKANFKANPKSVWQLLGAGSVGSQALLGIATVGHLKEQLSGVEIWPFETGFQSLSPETLEHTNCVIAEVYPSTLNVTQKPGEILDETQVRSLCEHFESLDSKGELANLFAPPDTLSEREIHKITAEEGWILAK